MAGTFQRTQRASAEVRRYWSAAATPRDFAQLMRTRLSYSRLSWAVGRPFEAEVDLRGFGPRTYLRSHTTDVAVLAELLVESTYEPAARLAGGRAEVIVDLGANTGLAGRWLLARNPRARLVCVEPEPGNAAQLRRNLDGRRFELHQACIADESGRVALAPTAYGALGFRMVATSAAGPGTIPARAMTMDELVTSSGAGRIDILKCDIEGAERALFERCRTWIGRVDIAAVECHWGFSGTDLLASIERNGASFELVHRDQTGAPGCEVVTVRNRNSDRSG